MPHDFQSSLYECDVVHERLLPRRHGFRYHLFFMDLWLDELPALERELRLFSVDRFNAYSFRNGDHLDLGAGHLRLNLEKWLLEHHSVRLEADWRIRLLTLPRIAGYFFNPVCFYFIYDASGKAVHALCEVTNTFHEMKPYFLAAPVREGVFELIVPKHFYVSPFSRLDTSFHFKLEVPGREIRLQVDDLENNRRTLASWIQGRRQPLTDKRLAFYFLRYPALTLQVIAKIHWQAFRLWWRGFEVFRKGSDRHLQTDLYHPHHSLTDS
ncbi:DUF1365 domain-containing protein [Brevifollis gellanilyticus]|uniref:DUF1365 domain-containing protein n=1 Tax=Brevifollis gellanilyticus TaxID=748831 RepID=A0A512M855_9BACT|nr:DUF1365 domain-containing protein [Brevifollis gellanilyticus]GEP42913.1 DUF1365 domain-containing protein [Brevifollis gellanilyticus]